MNMDSIIDQNLWKTLEKQAGHGTGAAAGNRHKATGTGAKPVENLGKAGRAWYRGGCRQRLPGHRDRSKTCGKPWKSRPSMVPGRLPAEVIRPQY